MRELFGTGAAYILALKLNQILRRIAENTFFLGFFYGNTLVVGIDMQNIAGLNIKMFSNILGYYDSAGAVYFFKICKNHSRTPFGEVNSFYHFTDDLSIIVKTLTI